MISIACVSIKYSGRNINTLKAALRCQQKQARAQQIKSHYSTTRYKSVLLASTGDPLRQITSHCCSEEVNITFLRLEAVTAMLLKIPVLWDLMWSLDEWFLMI
jgi:hypothetical protein